MGRVTAIARVALFAFGVALITSRVGLVVHELVGHGAVAAGFGADLDTWRLYWFAGGWIGYQKAGGWTWTSALIVQLGGIAVELLVAAALAVAARRRRGTVATALAGAALGLALHAGLYLVTGTADGFGDGTLLHRRLGEARLAVVVVATAALCGLGFVGARRLAGAVGAWLPVGSRAGRVIALAVALAAAGGAHAGLAVVETRARPNPTYRQIMATERDRLIARDLERWATIERARGHAPAAAAVAAERRRLERERPDRRLAPLLVLAVAAAVIAGAVIGAAAGEARQSAALRWQAAAWAVTVAALSSLVVGVLDALAPK